MGIQLLTAALGALGFSILFRIRGSKLLWTALGGLLTWGVFLLLAEPVPGLFLRSVLAACFAAFYAEICARIFKAPATIFLIPSAIPLIPGGSLYYTMSSAILGDAAQMRLHAKSTLAVALGISIGVAVVSGLFRMLTVLRRKLAGGK